MATTPAGPYRAFVPPVAPRRPHLHALTGLRFFAALYVVLYHYAKRYLADGPDWVDSFNRAGPVAVSLFFVLSGLVLTYGSTDADGRCNKPARQFWFARFSRVYPMFFVALIPALPANVAELHHTHTAVASVVLTAAQAVVAMLLLQAWVPHLAFVGNPPGWSLSVEAFFYLTFPFLVHRLRVRSLRRLVMVALPLWVLSMTPATLVEIIEHHGGLASSHTTSVLGVALTPALLAERLAAQFPLARLAEFCIGICIGHYVLSRIDRPAGAEEGTPVASRVRTPRAQRAISLAGLASIAAIAVLLTAAGDLHETSEIVVNSAFAAPLFAVLLVSLCLGGGPLVRLLSTRALTRLGAASYALYIVQDPFAWWWQKLTHRDLGQLPWLGVFLLTAIAVSVLCERWIENPARDWLLARRRDGAWPIVGRRRLRGPADLSRL